MNKTDHRNDNMFTRNLLPKIISILFALVMWIYVMEEINPQVTRTIPDVPIQLLNQEQLKSQELALMNGGEQTIRVALTGRRDEVNRVNKADIKATIDLAGYREGVNNIPIELNAITNIEVEAFPKSIRVELEAIISVQKEIHLTITGEPKVGYVLGQAQYKPTVVMIEGPESYVNSVDRVAANLEIEDSTENIVASLPLRAVNARGNEVLNVDVKTSYIDVFLPVDGVKTVRVVPDVTVTPGEGYVITDSQLSSEQVTVRGQADVLRNLTSVEAEPVVLDNLTQNVVQPLTLMMPEGVTRFDEAAVNMTIGVAPTARKSFILTEERIQFLHLSPELSAGVELGSELVEVNLEAVSEYLEELRPDAINLVFDVSNLAEGEYELTPELFIVELPEGYLKSYELNPEQVLVRIVQRVE